MKVKKMKVKRRKIYEKARNIIRNNMTNSGANFSITSKQAPLVIRAFQKFQIKKLSKK